MLQTENMENKPWMLLVLSGANYIEANEALGKKDFLMRIKICRKEAKGSACWLKLIIETNDKQCVQDGIKLLNEATELRKILSSILAKSAWFRSFGN
jgi:four helix bundle protein